MARIGRWIPPVALMALIFALSAQPDLGTGWGTWDTILRKLAHMAEFGLLWLLWSRAFEFRRPWLAAAITLGWSATDEVHQLFVEGRHGTPVDVLIDAVGVAITWGLTERLRRRRRTPQPA